VSRKLLTLVGIVLLTLAFGVWTVNGQDGGETEDQFEEVLIFTTATESVGIGTYVAGEAYAVPAGEDPAEEPVQALILPYGIYPSMHIEVIEDFVQPEPAVEGFAFEWELEAPDGSTAELMAGTVAIFLADVEGRYDLTLTATDDDGNSASVTWSVYATTYVGVGGMTGSAPEFPQCGLCHADKGRAWYKTGHATMFIRAIDGVLSDHYGPDCVSCHTTGFNNRPEADNGGFDDVARESGWVFPEELTEGNWRALVEQYPEVAALANIQCESCHGPGTLHVTDSTPDDRKIGMGMDYGTCAQCHAEDPYYTFPQQWELSAHADKNAQAFWYPIGEDRTGCVTCHSGAGYIDAANGVPQEELRTNYQVITCAVCHDPHDASNPNQLRVFDEVVLPDGTDVTDAGPAATCMTCHNSRVDPVASVTGVASGGNFSTPHYSTAAELMLGTGGFTWGEVLPSSPHGTIIEGACIGCHMAPTPGMDTMGTPDDSSDDQPLPGHETVGGHTFAMVSPVDGTENVAVCQTCHDGTTSFAFEAFRDYDGDGQFETNQEEVAGLQELLLAALEENGVVALDHYPYFEIPEDASEDIYGGVYNLKFSGDAASAVHNLRYTVSLLQLSYEQVAGEPVSGAYILSPK